MHKSIKDLNGLIYVLHVHQYHEQRFVWKLRNIELLR